MLSVCLLATNYMHAQWSISAQLQAPMSATPSHVFQPRASLFPLLHAARYPSYTIIGCLLGPSSSSEDSTTYVHAIPLLHHWTGLSFAIELGLTFVEEYAALKGWSILGLYFANEGLEDGFAVPQLVTRVVKAAKEMPGNRERALSVFAVRLSFHWRCAWCC